MRADHHRTQIDQVKERSQTANDGDDGDHSHKVDDKPQQTENYEFFGRSGRWRGNGRKGDARL